MTNPTVLIMAIVAVVSVMAGGMGYAISQSAPADRSARDINGCVRDREPVSSSIMLVDFTDKATAANLSQLDKAFADLRRAVPKDGKAVVMSLDVNAESGLYPVLDVCNPGPKTGNYTDRPGPSPQDQRWKKVYLKPFKAALEEAKKSPPSPDNSPILEAITALSQRADFDGSIGQRKLIIVSDGLQLTPKIYSHFKSGDLWKTYIKSALPAITQADLTDVDVTFVYLLRPEFAQYQSKGHREFLRRWFVEHGARSFEILGVRKDEVQ